MKFSIRRTGLPTGEKRTSLKGISLLIIIFCTVILFLVSTYFLLDPVGFRRVIFQPAREVRLFQNELGVLSQWNNIQKTVVRPTKKVILPSSGAKDLKLVADIYMNVGQRPAPLLLLLHGSDPRGRKAGLIQLLASRFKSLGWTVIAPDARGFGESADPQDLASPKAWRVKEDVRRAIKYGLELPEADTNRIHVLGHSLGAAHALEGALGDPNVTSIVLVGPPRFLNGRELSLWRRIRFAADRGLRQPISTRVLNARLKSSDILAYVQSLQHNCKKPILLIDGELEGEAHLDFLAKIARDSNCPINYQTLQDTSHYCGVRNLFGADTIYYRPDLFNPFVRTVVSFFGSVEAGGVEYSPKE